MIAIYPREGTETFDSRQILLVFADCNLSPRGDGNQAVIPAFRSCEQIAIYPREGTETDDAAPARGGCYCNLSPRGDGNLRNFALSIGITIAIYPREGTETFECNGIFNATIRLQFIPARGRKPP